MRVESSERRFSRSSLPIGNRHDVPPKVYEPLSVYRSLFCALMLYESVLRNVTERETRRAAHGKIIRSNKKKREFQVGHAPPENRAVMQVALLVLFIYPRVDASVTRLYVSPTVYAHIYAHKHTYICTCRPM